MSTGDTRRDAVTDRKMKPIQDSLDRTDSMKSELPPALKAKCLCTILLREATEILWRTLMIESIEEIKYVKYWNIKWEISFVLIFFGDF